MLALDEMGIAELGADAPVAVVGAALVDRVVSVPRLPGRGEDLLVSAPRTTVGGCGLNVARGLTRLGIPVVPLLPLGVGQNADAVAAELATLGLRTPLRTDDGDNGSCIALVEPDGERTFLTMPGIERSQGLAGLGDQPTPPGWIYVSGHELFGPAGEAILDWLARALPRRVVVDGGPRIDVLDRPLLERLARHHVVLTVNGLEAALAAARLVPGDADGLVGLSRLGDLTVIERRGARGARLVEPGGQVLNVACPAVSVRDTIGAGDAHTAGLLAGLASGWSVADSVALGCAAGAFSVTRAGPDACPTRVELQRFVASARSG